jgi:hypothetical protein
MGRGKGLGCVALTQSIRDISPILTQANIRILLKILESEIQAYGLKFGLGLARKLHSLKPREAYVFYGSETFFIKARPTLSQPHGLKDFGEISEYVMPTKAIQRFYQRIETLPAEVEGVLAPPPEVELTAEERRVIEILRDMGSECRSKPIDRSIIFCQSPPTRCGIFEKIILVLLSDRTKKVQFGTDFEKQTVCDCLTK